MLAGWLLGRPEGYWASAQWCDLLRRTRLPNTCTPPPSPTHLQLRLINTAGFAQFLFSVDRHRLIVVSLDGLTVQPSQPIRGVVLNAGQRMGVLVCPDGPRRRLADWGPAWVRAHMIQVGVRGPAGRLFVCSCPLAE